MGDVVLERNICFIDSPGHDSREIFQADSDPTIRYIDRLLHRNATFKSLTEHELLHILSGNGGVQVDLVLYVISNGKFVHACSNLPRLLLFQRDTTPRMSRCFHGCARQQM